MLRATQGEASKVSVRFDRRLYSFRATRRGHPVLSLRLKQDRIGLPIRRDGAYRRLQEHLKEGWEATSILMKRSLRFLVVLAKGFPEPKPAPNILGVDVNSGCLALSILSPQGKLLRQLYLGQDIAYRQARFEKRRARLQALRDSVSPSKAGRKLKLLSGRQGRFVKTRMWMIVSEILRLAKAYDATVAVEALRHLRKRRSEGSKASRKRVNRIPYGFFRHALTYKALEEGVKLVAVKPHYTSQTCPNCGYRDRENRSGRLFRCILCGFEANVDRAASVNICRRASPMVAVPNNFYGAQFSTAGATVNQPALLDERCERWHR